VLDSGSRGALGSHRVAKANGEERYSSKSPEYKDDQPRVEVHMDKLGAATPKVAITTAPLSAHL